MKNIVIVDIDGTVSKVGDRLKHLQKEPPDWDAFYEDCFEDEPVPEMVKLVDNLFLLFQYRIIFCTGRRESVRKKTEKWLKANLSSQWDLEILMRHDGDHRHDTEVKPELLLEAGIDLNDIAFVLEDRKSMVDKWRELGLICLQVAPGEF